MTIGKLGQFKEAIRCWSESTVVSIVTGGPEIMQHPFSFDAQKTIQTATVTNSLRGAVNSTQNSCCIISGPPCT